MSHRFRPPLPSVLQELRGVNVLDHLAHHLFDLVGYDDLVSAVGE